MNVEQSFRIRRATVNDLSVIMHHRRAMFEDMRVADSASLNASDAVAEPFLRKQIETGEYRAWLAEDNSGKILAGGGIIFLEYLPHPADPRCERAYVVNMYTDPEHRRQGLARAILSTMIDWCRERRMTLLFLHASDKGRALYESLGFKSTNEMQLDLRIS